MNKIIQMLTLQQQLNNATNGEGWEGGVTKNGKIINWRRCIYLECAELIESYPWKHWKNIDAQPDYENIKLEAVDIWHFIMSQGLEDYKKGRLGSIESLASTISALPNFDAFTAPIQPITTESYAQIEVVEVLLKALFCQDSTEALMQAFIDVAIQSSLNLDSLYTLYIGKNILNQFRQDHGYKVGRYIKVWRGREDNVVMQEILRTTPEISPQALYQALSDAYPQG